MYRRGHPLPHSPAHDTVTTIATVNSACFGCRKRKLRCDRQKPKCGTCTKARGECEYPISVKKMVSKRQSIKDLDGRLAFIETRLHPATTFLTTYTESEEEYLPEVPPSLPGQSFHASSAAYTPDTPGNSQSLVDDQEPFNIKANVSLELLSLGIQEPLPPESLRRDLFQLYFDIVHHHIPMMHQSKFFAALDGRSDERPPICLQYAMWCLAAQLSPEYEVYCDMFYARARKYCEAAELQGHAQNTLTIYHAQSWHLIATFEGLKNSLIPSWMSTGRCVRLVQMMGLQSIDDPRVEKKKLLSPIRDPIELEECRRTFWAAYFGDRWITAGTAWPLSINENQIFTRLPTSELAFERGMNEPGPFLSEVLTGDRASMLLSPFSGLLLAATLVGRTFAHVHNNTEQDIPKVTKGEPFWNRHRVLDNTLSGTFMHLPDYLRVSAGHQYLNIVFLHMSLHTSVICLHQAAAFTAIKQHLDSSIMIKSLRRCVIAADEITSMMKMISHHDIAKMSPWTGFVLYIAGRVYCHDLRIDGLTRRKSQSNLEFLLLAMNAIGNRLSVIKPYTTQLESKFRAVKLVTNRQVTGVVQGTSSTTASDICHTVDNRPQSDNKNPAGMSFEYTESDSRTNSPTPNFMDQPRLAGILPAEDLDDGNCPLQEAANSSLN